MSNGNFRSSAAQKQHQLDVINGTCGFDIKYLPRSVFKWHHQEDRAVSLTNSGDQARTTRCHFWRLAAVRKGKVPDHDVQGARKSGCQAPAARLKRAMMNTSLPVPYAFRSRTGGISSPHAHHTLEE